MTIRGGSLPLEPENGGLVGKFEAEKLIFNLPDRLLTEKLPFTIDNSGSSMFSIWSIEIRPELKDIRQDLVEIWLDLFEICRDLIEIRPDLAKIRPDLF